MTINSLLARFGNGPAHRDTAKQATEENAGLLQVIGEAARQVALLTAYANALRDGEATFAQLRGPIYESLALSGRMLRIADDYAPRVIARTVPHEAASIPARYQLEMITDAFEEALTERSFTGLAGTIDRLQAWRAQHGMTHEPFEGHA